MDAGCWEPWEGDSRPPAPPPPPIASGEWAGRPSGLARDMSKSLNCSPQGMPPLSILKPAPSAFSTPLPPRAWPCCVRSQLTVRPRIGGRRQAGSSTAGGGGGAAGSARARSAEQPCGSRVVVPGHSAGAQRTASRRRALAPLGARAGTRTATVHSARRALAELQPPVADASLWRGVWGAHKCAAGAQRGYREARPRGGKDRRKRAPRSGGRLQGGGQARGGRWGRLHRQDGREGAFCWCFASYGARA